MSHRGAHSGPVWPRVFCHWKYAIWRGPTHPECLHAQERGSVHFWPQLGEYGLAGLSKNTRTALNDESINSGQVDNTWLLFLRWNGKSTKSSTQAEVCARVKTGVQGRCLSVGKPSQSYPFLSFLRSASPFLFFLPFSCLQECYENFPCTALVHR